MSKPKCRYKNKTVVKMQLARKINLAVDEQNRIILQMLPASSGEGSMQRSGVRPSVCLSR